MNEHDNGNKPTPPLEGPAGVGDARDPRIPVQLMDIPRDQPDGRIIEVHVGETMIRLVKQVKQIVAPGLVIPGRN